MPKDPLAYLGFQLIKPSPILQPYVQSYWHFKRELPPNAYHEEYMHPRGGFGIGFNFGDNLYLDTVPLNDAVFLDGSNTVSRKMGFTGHVDLLGIRFYEGGAYPFMAIPLAELRNETALLDALDKPSLLRLYAQLYETSDLPEKIQILENWLLSRWALGKERDLLIPASLSMLQNDISLSIPNLAQKLAISQRQLERLYQQQVGMSPKQYTSLLRIETARQSLKQLNNASTTQLALNLGFYDQAHFIREFSATVGMTPYRYLQYSQKRPK